MSHMESGADIFISTFYKSTNVMVIKKGCFNIDISVLSDTYSHLIEFPKRQLYDFNFFVIVKMISIQ